MEVWRLVSAFLLKRMRGIWRGKKKVERVGDRGGPICCSKRIPYLHEDGEGILSS